MCCFLYFEVFKSHLLIPQDWPHLILSYVVLTLIEVSESGFIIYNKVCSIMMTQQYVILLMRFCAPTILGAQPQSELGSDLPLYRMYTCT